MILFELKEKMASLSAAIKADAEWISEKAADPSVKMEEIEAKEAHRKELESRYEMLKAQHDKIEAEQAEAVKAQAMVGKTAEETEIMKKAAFYKAALSGKNVEKSYEGLGGIPANDSDLGYGEHLLPKNVSNDLVLAPIATNPLRNICHITNISGLEEPKLGFTIEDADLADVTDKATANEIAMTGDVVSYGRQKLKVSATVKDTVLHGTNTNLVSAIEENLRSALAKREKHYAFLSALACTSDTAHAHMSFYNAPSGTPVIAQVEGATLFDALVAAYADLADEFAANASIVMSKADYYGMISTLTNSAEVLFTEKPASFLGIPVIFCDKATTPIVGDFSYYGINYDIDAIYETDKDAKKGEYYFVLTAWGDQQIRLASAFRQAVVNP